VFPTTTPPLQPPAVRDPSALLVGVLGPAEAAAPPAVAVAQLVELSGHFSVTRSSTANKTRPWPPLQRAGCPGQQARVVLHELLVAATEWWLWCAVLANLDGRDASGAAARADARAEDGRTPQTGTEEANGANVADGKGVEFGSQPGAGDGAKTAHGAAAKLETGRRR